LLLVLALSFCKFARGIWTALSNYYACGCKLETEVYVCDQFVADVIGNGNTSNLCMMSVMGEDLLSASLADDCEPDYCDPVQRQGLIERLESYADAELVYTR
jgi:hypothetical protein